MTEKLLNQSLSITLPEGFHEMDSQELKQVYMTDDSKRWGMWNREKHIMVTVLWKDYSLLLSKLAGLKTTCIKNEKLTAKGYKNHGYQCGEFFSQTVAGKQAEGYTFCYSIGDIRQAAETVLIKDAKSIYSITCVGRMENKNADHEVFSEILRNTFFEDHP